MIRNARSSDAGAISTLLHQLEHPSTPRHIRKQLDRIGSDDNTTILMAATRETIAGFLALQVTSLFHEEPPLARIIVRYAICGSTITRYP